LFCSPQPVAAADLAEALECGEEELEAALAEIGGALEARGIGLVLRQVAGGYTLASDPEAEPAVRRLLAKPRTPPLSQAQAECLAVTAYLRRVSRPEIARIRGVNSDSPMSTLEERGLIEECGRSRFGAVLYRTTPLFEKLFGLESLDALPDLSGFDPDAAEEQELREKLLRAGEQRAS
jgi:segregation and condensation protein B